MCLLAACREASALLSVASLDAASRHMLDPCDRALHSECRRVQTIQYSNRIEAAK